MEEEQASGSSNKCKRTTELNSSSEVDMDEESPLGTYINEKRMKKDDNNSGTESCERKLSDSEVELRKLFLKESEFSKKLLASGCGSTETGVVGESRESNNINEAANNCISDKTTTDQVETVACVEIVSTEKDGDDAKDKTEGNRKTPDKEEAEMDYDPTPERPRPKHTWTASRVTSKRQYGMPMHYSPDLFRYNCYGSLHMVERLELMYKMKKHSGCVNAIHFNASGTRLVSGSDDLSIILWDWTISEPVLEFNSGHRSNVFQAKFLPLSGDSQIVSCARDGQVRISELSVTGVCKSTRKLAQHAGAAHKLAVQTGTPYTFLSCGEDGAVFEMDLRKEKPEKLLLCKEDNKKVALYSIFINPSNENEYVIGGRDHYVRIYDKRYAQEANNFVKKYCPEHLDGSDIKANVTSVVYSYNGEEILASFNDEDIYLFDSTATDTSKYLHRYRGHRNSQTVKGVNFYGPKSEYIVSGSDCGYIFFWEKESEHIVKYMHGDEGGVVNCLEANPNMPVLATSGLDDDIKIWVPSCEDPPDLSGLREHVINNMKERKEERETESRVDDHMVWFLMHQIRRIQRSNARAAAGADGRSTSSSSDSEGNDGSDSNDDDSDFPQPIQCNQS